jgi:hypothetical protein
VRGVQHVELPRRHSSNRSRNSLDRSAFVTVKEGLGSPIREADDHPIRSLSVAGYPCNNAHRPANQPQPEENSRPPNAGDQLRATALHERRLPRLTTKFAAFARDPGQLNRLVRQRRGSYAGLLVSDDQL